MEARQAVKEAENQAPVKRASFLVPGSLALINNITN
jgi:hypothetical protein